jgi:hypothetical protein
MRRVPRLRPTLAALRGIQSRLEQSHTHRSRGPREIAVRARRDPSLAPQHAQGRRAPGTPLAPVRLCCARKAQLCQRAEAPLAGRRSARRGSLFAEVGRLSPEDGMTISGSGVRRTLPESEHRTWSDRHIVLRCVGRVARIRNSGSHALTRHGACATVIFLRVFQFF